MAPMRAMAEAMGYTFSYDTATGTAVCAKPGSAIEVSVDSTWATVNGKTTNWLAVPAELQGGIFCIPVRFFAEAAGVEVVWDPSGRNFFLSLKVQLLRIPFSLLASSGQPEDYLKLSKKWFCHFLEKAAVCRAQGVSVIGRHSHTCSLMCIQIEHQTRLTLSGLVLTLEFAMWRGCKVTYDMQQRQYG